MNNYPVVDRRDGRLFFTVDVTDRVSIATSVERLIDLLDAYEGDCDLEDSGDGEPSLGSSNDNHGGSQRFWAHGGVSDEREQDVSDEPHDDEGEAEPELGWTEHVDQSQSCEVASTFWFADGGEPWLGWSGDGIGYVDGYDPHEREADDADLPTFTFQWDGTGYSIGRDLIAKAAPRIAPSSRILGEKHYRLHDGGTFTTFLRY